MSELPSPSAQRLRKPSWRDSRLLIGVLMILTATAIGAFVMSRADTRVPMYAAKAGLEVGDTLSEDNVIREDVQLGAVADDYLSASKPPPKGTVLKSVGAGELIPRSAVGRSAEAEAQQLTLQVDATAANSLAAGSIVDVYVSTSSGAAEGAQKFNSPVVEVEKARVIAVAAEDDVFAGTGETRAVRILVPRAAVSTLVGSIDNGAKITLIPIPGGNTKSAS